MLNSISILKQFVFHMLLFVKIIRNALRDVITMQKSDLQDKVSNKTRISNPIYLRGNCFPEQFIIFTEEGQQQHLFFLCVQFFF